MANQDFSRQKAFREYKSFRASNPKVDVSFLDTLARRRRVCDSYDKFASVLNKFVEVADESAARGIDCYMVVDLEGDYVEPGSKQPRQPHYWHEHQIRQADGTNDDIKDRREIQSQLDKEFSRIKNKATRQKRRPEFEAQSRVRGLVQSDVFSLQLACIQDNDDELTAAVHMVKVAETADGRTLPPALFRLFSHKSIIWINVGIEEDLKALNRSFFNDSLCDIRWVEAKEIVEAVHGKPLPKQSDVQGEGVLGLFQRVFLDKKWTWKKSPLLTRSHWWDRSWTDDQVAYALMDVHSIVMVVREMLPRLPKPLGCMASPFPLRREKKAVALATKGTFIHDSVTAPFEFNESSDSEDDIFMSVRPAKVSKQMNVSTDDGVGTSFASSVQEVDAAVAKTADDEVIEDYRDVLLGDCPSEIDVDDVIPSTSASSDSLQTMSEAIAISPEFVVDVVDKNEFIAPLLTHVEQNMVSRLVKMLRAGAKINVRTVKSWPNMPVVLAKAAATFQRFSVTKRRNINLVLSFFASRWSEKEKLVFFENAAAIAHLLSPAKIIGILKMEDFSIAHLVTLHHEVIGDAFVRKPDMARPFLDLLGSVYGKTAAEKLRIFRSYDSDKRRARCFIEAADDAHLVQLCNQVARRHGLERPVAFRMVQLPQCARVVAKAVEEGVMSFDVALKSLTESVAGEKMRAMEMLRPYDLLFPHLMEAWGLSTDDSHPPPPPPPPVCADDEFHRISRRPIKILTEDLASQVVQLLQKEQRIYISVRECNDYCYDPSSLGAVGFTAAGWDEVFFLFPLSFPSPAKIIVKAIGQRKLVCINAKQAGVLLGPGFNLVWCAQSRLTRRVRGFFRSAFDTFFESVGVSRCPNHSLDPLVHPNLINPVVLKHIVAELQLMVESDKA